MAIVEVSIVPIGVPSTSLSSYVAQAVKILKDSSLKYELTAMGTIISGDIDEIWQVLSKMHESCFGPEVGRILTTVRIDDRRDRAGSPEQKIRSVMEKMSEE